MGINSAIMGIRIIPVNPGNGRGISQFIHFPHRLYRGNSFWVPELASSARLIFNQKRHPYYQHSTARFFLAESDNTIVGRLAVLYNRNYSAYYGQPTGFFTCYDAMDDQRVSNALLDAGIAWAKQQGVTSILGPRGFLRSQGFGLLVEGFNVLPSVGIPYNFPYYQQHLENYGFVKEADLLSGYMIPSDAVPQKIFEAADRVTNRGNFKILQFKHKRDLLPWINQLDRVYREAFLENPNYYPTTSEEFALMAKNIYAIANPRLIKIITYDSDIAGFILAYPNINRAIQKSRGRLFPFGWLFLQSAIRRTDHIDINGLGILPQYQGRGANLMLYAEVERTLRSVGATYAEMVQVDERNFNSFSDSMTIGVHMNKRHRLYRLNL
jgi:GNAT superfamily N-acetyltransferase